MIQVFVRTQKLSSFEKEIENLKVQKPIQRDSAILKLDPFIDNEGVLRVGGLLKHSNVSLGENNPILIHGSHAIAKLLVFYYHELIRHQGRHITEGKVRSAGLWITGLYSVISKCVLCRRFHGNITTQKMSDLPEERLKSCPPFTYVGVDCFCPLGYCDKTNSWRKCQLQALGCHIFLSLLQSSSHRGH